MFLNDVANIRLAGQQITTTKFKTPEQLVTWMGAMQAQDYNMAKWAIGVRLPDVTDKIIQTYKTRRDHADTFIATNLAFCFSR